MRVTRRQDVRREHHTWKWKYFKYFHFQVFVFFFFSFFFNHSVNSSVGTICPQVQTRYTTPLPSSVQSGLGLLYGPGRDFTSDQVTKTRNAYDSHNPSEKLFLFPWHVHIKKRKDIQTRRGLRNSVNWAVKKKEVHWGSRLRWVEQWSIWRGRKKKAHRRATYVFFVVHTCATRGRMRLLTGKKKTSRENKNPILIHLTNNGASRRSQGWTRVAEVEGGVFLVGNLLSR